jgi:hypothetical protein
MGHDAWLVMNPLSLLVSRHGGYAKTKKYFTGSLKSIDHVYHQGYFHAAVWSYKVKNCSMKPIAKLPPDAKSSRVTDFTGDVSIDF